MIVYVDFWWVSFILSRINGMITQIGFRLGWRDNYSSEKKLG